MRQMKQKKIIEPLKLPSRPRRPSQVSGTVVPLVTNHFKVSLGDINKIYIYFLDFHPKIEISNRKLKDQIMEQVRKQAHKDIGQFIVTGSNAYSKDKPGSFNKSVTYYINLDSNEYSVTFKEVGINYVEDLKSMSVQKQGEALKFFNVLVKYFLKQLKFSEFGKVPKYYDMQSCQEIPGTDLTVYGGFDTSFNIYERGLFLRICVVNKIVRRDTMLSQINQIYGVNNKDKSREEIRYLVRQMAKGQVILANYGNFRYYRVVDVVFDKNSRETFIDKEKKTSLYDFYKKLYNLEITAIKQPLFSVETGKINGKKIMGYVIPEFCMMTGIPSDFNEFQRKKVNNLCRKTAEERVKLIEELSKKLNSQELSTQELQEKMGIKIETKAYELEGRQVKPPTLIFGNQEQMEGERVTNWQMKNSIYGNPSKDIKWCLIHFREFDHQNFIKNFYTLSKQYKFGILEPKRYDIGIPNRRAMEEVEYILDRKVDGVYNICLLIFPNNFKYHYTQIKRMCTVKRKIITQFCFQATLDKKFSSVCGKLMQQIASKCGAILWVPKPFCGFPSKTMIIGMNMTRDKKNRNKTFATMVSTRNEKFSKFYSRVSYQSRGTETIENIQQLIKEAITAFYKTCEAVPENIIYLREGVGPQSIGLFQKFELEQIHKAFISISEDFKPKFTAILVEKQVQQKFYQKDSKGITNPPSGTFISEKIVSRNYDFYLIGQDVTQGTVTPTHYNIIYDTSGFTEQQMQELLYSQCFNYMNWNGVIRVPAPLQYAYKLSQFISMHINEETHQDLRKSLYYL